MDPQRKKKKVLVDTDDGNYNSTIQLEEKSANDSSSCEVDQHPSMLPDLAVKEVLKNIPSSDQQTVLNCRLVCVQWNYVIKDTSELMRRITFPIWHPKPFLQLEIVKKGNVKSISFRKPFQLNSTYTDELFDLISDKVENVKFAFDEDLTRQQYELFILVLKKCSNLRTLIMNKVGSIVFDSRLIQYLKIERAIAAANKITRVSFAMDNFYEDEARSLSELLAKFPYLTEIELLNNSNLRYNPSLRIILKGLCEYLKMYAVDLRLKKLRFVIQGLLSKLSCEDVIILLILCGKHSVTFEEEPMLSFNCLLGLTENLHLPSLIQRPLFQAKVSGRLKFDGAAALTNLDRLLSLNINVLCLHLKRAFMAGELNWIHELGSLEFLILQSSLGFGSPKNVTELASTFSLGLPNLKGLQINNDVFDTVKPSTWIPWFPNLEQLHIHDCELQNVDLVLKYAAVELESLSYLELISLPNLEDNAFTTHIDLEEFDIPVIAYFKLLKKLKIDDCDNLTENCVINGISKCKTLEKIIIRDCRNLSENCFEELVKCQVDFSDGIDKCQDPTIKILADYEGSSDDEDVSGDSESSDNGHEFNDDSSISSVGIIADSDDYSPISSAGIADSDDDYLSEEEEHN